MKPIKHYTSATAFRRALEDRLKHISRERNIDLQRLRRQVAFDRLLCRLFHKADAPWVLKGGYAMELRADLARTTKDIDLAIRTEVLSSTEEKIAGILILNLLRDHASIELQDFFRFEIGESTIELEAVLYGGGRYPVRAFMDGRLFISFHVDAGIGGVMMDPPEVGHVKDWLGFAGIASIPILMLPKEQQFAEKIHAYTLPREESENSRVKDLVDMLLLIQNHSMDRERVKDAIDRIFAKRATHTLRGTLLPPPASWTTPFATMALECALSSSLQVAFDRVQRYLDEM